MLLGNTHIEKAVGELLLKILKARAAGHARGYGTTLRLSADTDKRVTKHFGIGAHFCSSAACRFPGQTGRCREKPWGRARRLVALAFTGNHMEQNRALEIFDIAQIVNQQIEAVAGNRSDIDKPELLKKLARQKNTLKKFFRLPGNASIDFPIPGSFQ